jgi:hypothetical protein
MAKLMESERGYLDASGNEVFADSIIDDPPKYRQGSPVRGGAFGCISGDRLVFNDDGSLRVRLEKVLLILKPDDSGGEGGCYDFFAQRPNTEDDQNMVRVARLTTQSFEVFVPLVQHAGGVGPAPIPQPPLPAPAPAPQPQPEPVPQPAPEQPVRIPEGDFDAVTRHYGFPSDDEQPYREGRLTWAEVIARMERRK